VTANFFAAKLAKLRANRNKLLTDEQINELSDLMRATADRIKHQRGNGSGR
jgi:hypothetical protein